MKGIIVVKAHRCMACKSCELACAVEHSSSQILEEAVAEYPRPSSRVKVKSGEGFAIPLQCRQCEDAPCVAVCPTNALYRDNPDSPVIMDQERCIGCKWCVLACPFGVIRLDEKARTIIKCDQCIERLNRGEMPACVSSCPTGALEFKCMEDIISEKREAFLLQIKSSFGEEK